MFAIIKTAALVAMLATPGTRQKPFQDIYFDRPACDELNQFMLRASNNTCNTYATDGSTTCNSFIDKIGQTNPTVIDTIQKLQRPCLEEGLTTSQLQYEKIGCKQKNLKRDRVKVCKQLKENIKNLNALLENNHQQ